MGTGRKKEKGMIENNLAKNGRERSWSPWNEVWVVAADREKWRQSVKAGTWKTGNR